MEYLDAEFSWLNVVIVPLIVAGFFLAIGLLFRMDKLLLAVVPTCVFVIGVVFAPLMAGWVTAPHDQYEAQIREVYGIAVDSVHALKFPTDRPDGFEAFGSTAATRGTGDDAERLEVELVWKGDQFVLYGTNRAALEPLQEASERP